MIETRLYKEKDKTSSWYIIDDTYDVEIVKNRCSYTLKLWNKKTMLIVKQERVKEINDEYIKKILR